jgi:hypothetical protein
MFELKCKTFELQEQKYLIEEIFNILNKNILLLHYFKLFMLFKRLLS